MGYQQLLKHSFGHTVWKSYSAACFNFILPVLMKETLIQLFLTFFMSIIWLLTNDKRFLLFQNQPSSPTPSPFLCRQRTSRGGNDVESGKKTLGERQWAKEQLSILAHSRLLRNERRGNRLNLFAVTSCIIIISIFTV